MGLFSYRRRVSTNTPESPRFAPALAAAMIHDVTADCYGSFSADGLSSPTYVPCIATENPSTPDTAVDARGSRLQAKLSSRVQQATQNRELYCHCVKPLCWNPSGGALRHTAYVRQSYVERDYCPFPIVTFTESHSS